MLDCKRLLMMSVLAVPTTTLLAADDPQPATQTTQASEAVPKEVIERWISDLDSDNFDTRQAATRKLADAGQQVIEQVRQAATGDSLEVTSRSVDVLAKLMESKDKATADAAKAALKKLAESDHKSAARRAGKALEPPPADPNQNAAGGVIVGNGGIQIQIQPGQIQGARIIKLQQNNANGEKSTEVEDDGRKVKIKENKDGIQIDITETDKNGKTETKTYKAKDAEELKKKHPEAHKLYEKYGKGNAARAAFGNIQIQAQALPAGIPVRMRRLMPQTPQEKKALEQMQQAQKQLEELTKELKKLGENNGVEGIAKITDQIEKISKQIEEARGALDRTKAN